MDGSDAVSGAAGDLARAKFPEHDCEGGSGDGPNYTRDFKVVGSDVFDLDRRPRRSRRVQPMRLK